MLFGLKLAWRKGYKRIILESDLAIVVSIFLGREVINEIDRVIVDSCKKLLSCQWVVKVEQVLKEANRAADWIEKWALSLGFEKRELLLPPLEMNILLEEDALGIQFTRSNGLGVMQLALSLLCNKKFVLLKLLDAGYEADHYLWK